MCSMIEDLGKMFKNIEWQFNQKRNETENILLNMTNIQRKIDEN